MAETVVAAKPLPQNQVDPDVKLPPSVAAAAAAAEALHKQAYSRESPPAEPAPQPPPAPPEPVPASAEPAPSALPEPPPPSPPSPPSAPDDPAAKHPFDPNTTARDYYHRFISMQGRWRSAQDQAERLQGEVQAIGDELVRTQQVLAAMPPPPYQNGGYAAAAAAPPTPLVTPQDEQQFGTEVIDLARRVARETLAPELDAFRTENEQLRAQLQRTGKQTLFSVLDERIPEWRRINTDPAFKRWLGLRDIYSGGVRQQLLDVAVKAADAPRVAAFFTGFLREAAQGQPSQPQPAPLSAEPPPTSKVPPLSLETLAAPGRARPAPGEQPATGDKPVYTRAQISRFYADARRGLYAGRESDKAAIERDIFAAQQEGRVR